MTQRLPMLQRDAFLAAREWINAELVGSRADSVLLSVPIEDGRIAGATIDKDTALVFLRDEHRQRAARLRTARRMDLPSYAFLLISQAPRVDARIARNVVGDPERQRHYVSVEDDTPYSRVISDAGPGQEVRLVDGDHYNLRRDNLWLAASNRGKFWSRARVIDKSVYHFDRLPEDSWLRKEISVNEFKRLLHDCLPLVDRTPLGEIKAAE